METLVPRTERDGKVQASTWRAGLVIWFALALLAQSVLLTSMNGEAELKLNLALQTGTLIVFALWTWNIGATHLNPPLVFAACIYIWHSTFLVGHYFHLAPIFEYSGNAFSYGFEQIHKATALVGLSLGLTVFGVMIAYTRQHRNYPAWAQRKLFVRSRYSSLGKATTRAAGALCLSLLLIAALFISKEGMHTFAGSYMDAYYEASSSLSYLLFYRTQFLWPVVIILLTATNRSHPSRLALVGATSLGIATLTAMLGSRSEPFICLCAFVVSFDCLVKRIRLWILALFLICMSAASYVIDNDRGTGLGVHVFRFSDSGKDKLDLWHFFYQNGLDIRAVLRTMEFSNDSEPEYGLSFLDAGLSVIPKPILDRIGYEQPIQPSVWMLRNSPDVGFYNGLGYSLVAEMYYNFRMAGCIGFLFVGWLLGRSYFKFLFSDDIFMGLNSMITAVIFTLHMRSDSGVYMRLLIYSFIIIAILKHLRNRSTLQSKYSKLSGRVPPELAPA